MIDMGKVPNHNISNKTAGMLHTNEMLYEKY